MKLQVLNHFYLLLITLRVIFFCNITLQQAMLSLSQCQTCIGQPLTSPSNLKGPGTSKLDWRYFEHYKVDRNELQVHKICIKAQEQIWPIFFCQIVQFFSHFCSCAFMQIFENLDFTPIKLIVFKVPPVQFWSLWFLEVTLVGGYLSLCFLS